MTPPPFGTFPKIHPFWKGKASLSGHYRSILNFRLQNLTNFTFSVAMMALASAAPQFQGDSSNAIILQEQRFCFTFDEDKIAQDKEG